MAIFTWRPSQNPTRTLKPRVRSAPFGDGYEQRIPNGINTQMAAWAVAFNGKTKAVADAIDAFLAARGGAEAFDWTDPTGHAGKFICREWSRVELARGIARITANFEEVPA